MTDQREMVTRSRLAQLLDDEADLAAKTGRDAARDIRAGDDPRNVIYPNVVWGGDQRSRRNVDLFGRVKDGEVTVVDD